MTENPHDGESHSGEITESIADERLGWVPVRRGVSTFDSDAGENVANQLCLSRPKQTPMSGSMKYRLK